MNDCFARKRARADSVHEPMEHCSARHQTRELTRAQPPPRLLPWYMLMAQQKVVIAQDALQLMIRTA